MTANSVTDEALGPDRRQWDLGRLVMVPLLTLAVVANAAGLFLALPENGLASTAGVAVLGRHLLLLAFYALLAWFYLVRGPARATNRSPAARAAAIAAMLSPFALPFLTRDGAGLLVVAGATVLSGLGVAWSVWAIRHLGRNISIVPEARQVVSTGPYRWVRHPLYLGEMVAALGIVLAGFTWAALAVWAAMGALLLVRAGKEEDILAATFPDYSAYRARTARVIPSVY